MDREGSSTGGVFSGLGFPSEGELLREATLEGVGSGDSSGGVTGEAGGLPEREGTSAGVVEGAGAGRRVFEPVSGRTGCADGRDPSRERSVDRVNFTEGADGGFRDSVGEGSVGEDRGFTCPRRVGDRCRGWGVPRVRSGS